MASSAESLHAELLIWSVRFDRTDQIRFWHESQSKINTAPLSSEHSPAEIKSRPSDQLRRLKTPQRMGTQTVAGSNTSAQPHSAHHFGAKPLQFAYQLVRMVFYELSELEWYLFNLYLIEC